MQKRFTAAAVTAAFAAALILTGCAGGGGTPAPGSTSGGSQEEEAPPAAADQSKDDACAIVEESMTEFASINAELDPANPEGAVDSFRELAASTTESLASITNAEVKPAAEKAALALSDYVDFLEVVITDPAQASDLGTKVTELQEGFTEVSTVCAS